MNYWNHQAAWWVSFSVLAGGLVSAGILFWVVKIENDLRLTSII